MTISKHRKLKAKEFDAAFEKRDVTEHLNLQSIKVNYPTQRLSIDFTKNMVEEVDQEAAKIGVTRTSLIKMWIAEKLSKLHGSHTDL